MSDPQYSGKERLVSEIVKAAEQKLSEMTFQFRCGDDPAEIEEAIKQIDLPTGLDLPKIKLVEGHSRREAPALSPDGEIIREGDHFVVRACGSGYAGLSGVSCENPEAPEAERVYRKEFHNKEIYLPGELEKAKAEMLGGSDAVVLGMTGFSKIGAENCARWGVSEAAYVAACSDLLAACIIELKKEFPGIGVRIVDGASDLGVDKAVIDVADKMLLSHLGFSCPKFMFYVEDDSSAVYVAPNQAAYSDAFIKSLDILFSVGGRLQALNHDLTAAIVNDKRIVLLNVLEAIAPNGAPPARDGSGSIQDATAAFNQAVIQIDPAGGVDDYESMRADAQAAVRTEARKIMGREDPKNAYSRWKRGE